ncbi:Mature T-cell proliferation 1 neighbor protein [Trachymyrmex septentrionalis]|uniref:Mature T-cell proliferation 1 neighbor protein n=1 Tax=Trachymyrmex septentrionalis TaxID=34720 RepID=A0A195FCK9_9HYME|nr:Mature T-cell proliferation 1 neighbor protein [Trachymyrmex septentrionalis]
MSTTDPCKKIACKLQTCLQDNVFQPSRCQDVLEQIRKCCMKHSDSAVCDGINILKPYEHNTVDYVSLIFALFKNVEFYILLVR